MLSQTYSNIIKNGLLLLAVLSVNFAYCQSALAKDIIIFPKQQEITHQQNNYFYQLITLVMEKTKDNYGEYQISPYTTTVPQARAIKMLERGLKINLLWTMTSKAREESLGAIYFPLQKGLLSHRVFIIRKQDQIRFSSINSLEQLKQLTAGQGHDWPDTKILISNGLPVQKSPDYDSLFAMLKAHRFDYYPRGLTEATGELEQLNDDSLALESELLLRYPAPLYFFVNKNNLRLKNRLTDGLIQAHRDGSFDALFYNQPNIKKALHHSNLENRRVFDLANPDTLNKDGFEKSEFWLDISKFNKPTQN